MGYRPWGLKESDTTKQLNSNDSSSQYLLSKQQSGKVVKNLLSKRVWSLGREDLLENDVAPHSSILACRIPVDRGAWWATGLGVSKSRTRLSN